MNHIFKIWKIEDDAHENAVKEAYQAFDEEIQLDREKVGAEWNRFKPMLEVWVFIFET